MQKVDCGGIYRIDCLPTGWSYIGGCFLFNERWSQHRVLLRRGKHHNAPLQAEWARLGEEQFGFSVIETLWQRSDFNGLTMNLLQKKRTRIFASIVRRERLWIERCRSQCPLYNDAVPGRRPQIAPVTVEDCLAYLADHAHFGYAAGVADYVGVCVGPLNQPVVDALQQYLGGRVVGPYRSSGRTAFHWRIRGEEMTKVIELLAQHLPPGQKREQFEIWKPQRRAAQARKEQVDETD